MKLPYSLPTAQGQASQQAQKDKIFRRRLAICIAFLFCCYLLPSLVDHILSSLPIWSSEEPVSAALARWPAVLGHRHLEYHPCYEGQGADFQCARLLVPLDHFNQTTDGEISLAIIKLPAAVPPGDPRYGGAILFNPGGPGGSGVGFLQRAWKQLHAAIHEGEDSSDTKLYDFISFDPRGVALSVPPLECFSSGLLSWTWLLRELQEGILGSSDAAFGRLWSMSTALGGSCSLSAKDAEDIKKFVTTASVAADMIKIVEAHGLWREKTIEKSLAEQALEYLHIEEYDPSKEKINYWGFSYGTYLGMTTASMFPGRIGHFIIDGVVDAVDYTKSLWFDNLADTEKEMETFYEYCASAGYPSCAIANKIGASTAAGVKERTVRVIENLYHNPLPIISENPDIISYSDVRNLIFAGLYKPIQSFPLMASVFAELEAGNGTQMAQIMAPYHQPTCSTDDEQLERAKLLVNPNEEASIAISCTDGDPQDSFTRADFKTHLNNMVKLSPTVGPMWAAFRMRCAHYTVRALHRYPGPWEGNTAQPILLIGNSADPVTPVRNARAMAKGYRDARVLEVGGSGHCSIAAPSRCARKVIFRLFQYGELPEHGAYCEADEFPFDAKATEMLDIQELLSSHIEPSGGMLMPMV